MEKKINNSESVLKFKKDVPGFAWMDPHSKKAAFHDQEIYKTKEAAERSLKKTHPSLFEKKVYKLVPAKRVFSYDYEIVGRGKGIRVQEEIVEKGYGDTIARAFNKWRDQVAWEVRSINSDLDLAKRNLKELEMERRSHTSKTVKEYDRVMKSLVNITKSK